MRKNRLCALVVFGNLVLFFYFTMKRHQLEYKLVSIQNSSNWLENSNRALFEQLDKLSNKDAEHMKQLQQNYEQLKDLTEFSRNTYLRVKGIPEKEGEALEEKVLELAEYMGIKMTPSDINQVNRIGARKPGKPRIIVVQLHSFKLKSRLLREAASALKNTPFAVQDDATNYVMPADLNPVQGSSFREGCGLITNVSKPVTKAQSKKMFGAWLQDPVPSLDGIRDSYIWVLPHFFQNSVVEEYANIHELSHRRSRTSYELPYEWAGTGHVVFNGSLYFTKFNSSCMVQYSFSSRSVLKENNLHGAAYANNAPYQWSGSTDIDFSVDEYGLWAIYATVDNALDIVLSRIDPQTLEVLGTWKTNWRKQWSGNAFMHCGVLYVLKRYDEKASSLSYTYNTKTKRYKRLDISFTNRYEWNSMLEYNPRTGLLYAWDRGYLVNYNITISKS